MTKRLITTVLAASIALTAAFTAPVRAADSGEIARFVLGAGALFIIGNELSKHNRNNGRDHDRDYVTRRYDEPRAYREKPRRKVVPVACLRQNDNRGGPRRYFGLRCLQNNMRHAGRLPGYCQTTIWGRNGQRTVYAARCLRNDGWTFG